MGCFQHLSKSALNLLKKLAPKIIFSLEQLHLSYSLLSWSCSWRENGGVSKIQHGSVRIRIIWRGKLLLEICLCKQTLHFYIPCVDTLHFRDKKQNNIPKFTDHYLRTSLSIHLFAFYIAQLSFWPNYHENGIMSTLEYNLLSLS